jgi:ABC-type sugar transport system substrate-binding protein
MMGRFLTLALLLVLLLAAAPAAARDPVLTIFYTGNTYGEIAPCPT